MNSAFEKHYQEYSQEPLLVVEVPSVSVLFGEFSDYCKGWSVCAANDLKLQVAVSKREDSIVKMSNAYSGDHKKFSLSGIKFRKEDRWGNFVKGVVSNIQNSNGSICGLNMTFSGTLLASDPEIVSSAMGIGSALAINKLFDLGMDESQIMRHVYLSSTVFCHERCKYMVLQTMLKAQKDKMFLFDNLQVSYRPVDFEGNIPDLGFYLIESRVPPLAMREESHIKNSAMKKAFEILRSNYPNANLREIPESELSERVIEIDEESRQICSWILEESRITKEAFKALEAKDYIQLGKLLTRVQKGLRDRLDLTCPEVDWLVKRANEISGCFGACMIPTGLSGSILALMTESALEGFKASRLSDYEHIFGFSAKIRKFRCCGSARILS